MRRGARSAGRPEGALRPPSAGGRLPLCSPLLLLLLLLLGGAARGVEAQGGDQGPGAGAGAGGGGGGGGGGGDGDQPAGGPLPELPVADGKGIPLTVGSSVKLEELGPVVVTEECKLRRISNWDVLSAREQEVAWRRISTRNNARLEECKKAQAAGVLEGAEEHPPPSTLSLLMLQPSQRHRPAERPSSRRWQ